LSIQIGKICKLIILSIAAVENFDHDNFLESCTNSEHCNSWNNIKINIILQQHMLYL